MVTSKGSAAYGKFWRQNINFNALRILAATVNVHCGDAVHRKQIYIFESRQLEVKERVLPRSVIAKKESLVGLRNERRE